MIRVPPHSVKDTWQDTARRDGGNVASNYLRRTRRALAQKTHAMCGAMRTHNFHLDILCIVYTAHSVYRHSANPSA